MTDQLVRSALLTKELTEILTTRIIECRKTIRSPYAALDVLMASLLATLSIFSRLHGAATTMEIRARALELTEIALDLACPPQTSDGEVP